MLSKVLSFTADKQTIVTIGIKSSRPETGYGYIAAAEPTEVEEIYKVEAFKEKPNLETADEKKVVVQGLDGYIVAEKNGQLLVCSLKEEQRIKGFEK